MAATLTRRNGDLTLYPEVASERQTEPESSISPRLKSPPPENIIPAVPTGASLPSSHLGRSIMRLSISILTGNPLVVEVPVFARFAISACMLLRSHEFDYRIPTSIPSADFVCFKLASNHA